MKVQEMTAKIVIRFEDEEEPFTICAHENFRFNWGINRKIIKMVDEVKYEKVETVRGNVAKLLSEIDHPQVIFPDTFDAIRSLLGPSSESQHKVGAKERKGDIHYAKVWCCLWEKELEKSDNERGCASAVDKILYDRGLSRKKLKQIKAKFRDFINREMNKSRKRIKQLREEALRID